MRTGIVTTVVGILIGVSELLSILYGLTLIPMLSEDGVHGGAALIVPKAGLALLYFCLKGFCTLIPRNSSVMISEVKEIPELEALI